MTRVAHQLVILKELRQTLREAFNDWSAAEEGHSSCWPWSVEHESRLAFKARAAFLENEGTWHRFGLLDRVVWVRSDFPSSGVYNGPPPGEHK
eukprot:3075925-Amphidinium_carterae.1